ncbi:Cholesterol 7-desaturase [Larimichthys crocea]|uniref:Uncharacterized protein n=1 Tax=Larimichthys crocea TaxID=215358 RepID=A0ACD3QQ12_LARCR|nr:Cholesterol 7-desaturase [Larimichthys crocea]
MFTGNRFALIVVGVGAVLVLQYRDALDSTVCVIAGVSVLAVGWLHRLLFSPLEVLRSPDDVGYIAENGRSKAQAANDVRRRRKTGELPPVYPNGWYRVLDSQLLERGEVKNVTVLGEQVAVFRGQNGRVYVLDAYCPHLGANLGVGGRVVGGCLECPFHGWQFRGDDGKCVKIPYAEKVPEFAKVRSWPTCEVNGQVLVWFHCDGEEPHWTVPEHEEVIKGEWVYRGRTEHFISAHIQAEEVLLLPNFKHSRKNVSQERVMVTSPPYRRFLKMQQTLLTWLTCTLRALSVEWICRYMKKSWGFLRHEWKAQWEPESEPNQHCSQMLVNHVFKVFGHDWHLLDVHVVARQVGPGVVFLLFNHSFLGRGLIMQCVTPVEPLLQCVSHFERDVTIWNNKKYVSKPLLVKEDSAIQKHRRWYSQFYSENSPRLQYQRDTLDF